MRILRNIFRRKMRAFLTIFGISIGVFLLVVMGDGVMVDDSLGG